MNIEEIKFPVKSIKLLYLDECMKGVREMKSAFPVIMNGASKDGVQFTADETYEISQIMITFQRIEDEAKNGINSDMNLIFNLYDKIISHVNHFKSVME
jgi:hypothetical protein